MSFATSHTGRRLAVVALALGLTLSGRAAPVEEPATKTAESPAEKVRKDLDKPVTVDLAEQPLTLAMNQLRETTKVNIVVDRNTLNQMGIDPDSLPVTENLKDVKLRTALRQILAKNNLSFAVVGDSVVVSTDDMCMHRQMRQRVQVDFEKAELATALRKPAKETGTNVVIDPKVAREAATPVTMQLDDVPYEMAVKLMTEMAGLKAVRLGNVLFVCSKEKAAELRQDPDFAPNPNGGGPVLIYPLGRTVPNVLPNQPPAGANCPPSRRDRRRPTRPSRTAPDRAAPTPASLHRAGPSGFLRSAARDEDRRRGDAVRRALAGVGPAAAGQAADAPDGHVPVADDLTAETHPGQALGLEDLLLGFRHLVRLAGEELDPARRAAGVPAAGVELVDPGLVDQGQDEALPGRNLELADPFDRQQRHGSSLPSQRAMTAPILPPGGLGGNGPLSTLPERTPAVVGWSVSQPDTEPQHDRPDPPRQRRRRDGSPRGRPLARP